MQDDANWPESEPPKAKSSLGDIILPLLTFALGAGLTYVIFTPPAPLPGQQPGVATFGSAPQPQPSAAAIAPNALEELELMRDINAGFVQQLRDYRTRLNGLADDTEKEGAPVSAESMREFADETGRIIDRYDMIVDATKAN